MFSGIRKRLTYTNVVVTFALVFAMSGGAYAANHYLITSTKQIKPSVLASLKGRNGANGAPGSQGPAGPAGPAGAQGGRGENGAPGTNGAKGATGSTGPAGPTGAAGQTGFTETLPSGKTETGAWIIGEGAFEEEHTVYTTISFPIPVTLVGKGHSEFLSKSQTEENPQATETHECQGTVEHPTAPAGYLCVYTTLEKASNPFIGLFVTGFGSGNNYSPSGAIVDVETGTPGSQAIEKLWGTWAVTAP